MKNEIPVAIFEPTKSHSHPALYVGGKKNEATVFDDKLEVRVEELEDEVQIFLGRENIKKLVKAGSAHSHPLVQSNQYTSMTF